MGEGATSRKSDLDTMAQGALGEFKDWIILFDMAGDYLCGKPMLEKMASAIEANCTVLKDWSEELKERFVGKPLHEIDLEKPFEDLGIFSRRLLEADNAAADALCRGGKVTRQFEESIQFLKQRLKALQDRVEGEGVPYTAKDSVSIFFGKLRFIVHGLVSTYKLATRITCILLLAGLMSFLILYVTMEKEADVVKRVQQSQHIIQTKKAELSGIKSKINRIRDRTMEMDATFVTREDKIEILELNLKSHQLSNLREKIQVQMDAQKKMLDEDARKLDRMKRKSLIARLLRW